MIFRTPGEWRFLESKVLGAGHQAAWSPGMPRDTSPHLPVAPSRASPLALQRILTFAVKNNNDNPCRLQFLPHWVYSDWAPPDVFFLDAFFWRHRGSCFTERQLTYRRLSIPIAVTATQSLTDCHCHCQKELGPLGTEQTSIVSDLSSLEALPQGPLSSPYPLPITLNRRATPETANFTGPFPHPYGSPSPVSLRAPLPFFSASLSSLDPPGLNPRHKHTARKRRFMGTQAVC